MKIIIDRFEGNFAVVELPNKKMINMPKTLVPEKAKEGDVLSIEINRDETEKRGKEIKNLMDDLFE